MKYIVVALVVLALSQSCSTDTVKDDTEKPIVQVDSNLSEAEQAIEPLANVVEKKEFPNGIKIQWFEHGSGPKLTDGSVYEINFKLKLKDGKVVDGNHLLKRDMLPFLVGYQMQTTGWDIAMKELTVGDFVEIYLPANLARGERGIPGKIPPNSPNIIFLRIGKEIKPTKVVDGVKVWCLQETENTEKVAIKENSAVSFHYFVGTKSNPRYDNSYQRNLPFSFRMSDASLVPGLKKGLTGRHMFDKLWVLVPAKEAYGDKGYVDLVKPNEELFYDLLIMDVDGESTVEK